MILFIEKINSQKITNLKIETQKYFIEEGNLNASEYENAMECSKLIFVKRGQIYGILTENRCPYQESLPLFIVSK